MNEEINYKNNPLHGVSLKKMLTALVDHYGFEILFAYLNINCFRSNPSIQSAIKFLKKTDWAREKVESFYLYEFKSLPRASYDQHQLPPRERIIPDEHSPGEPAVLSLEDAEQRRSERQRKAADYDRKRKPRRPPAPRGRSDREASTEPKGRTHADASSEALAASSGFNPWTQKKKP